MSEENTADNTKDVPKDVRETKQFRKDLDEILTNLKGGLCDRNPYDIHRTSRERSISITKIQEAIMWLGMDLKAQREDGESECKNPYPESYNPDSATIKPTADGLKL